MMLYELKKPEYNHGKNHHEGHCKVEIKPYKSTELWEKYYYYKIYIYNFIHVMSIMCICHEIFQIIFMARRRHVFSSISICRVKII